jgi:hypothetical protein
MRFRRTESAHEAKRDRVLRDAEDRAPDKRAIQKELRRSKYRRRPQEGDELAQRQRDRSDLERGRRVSRRPVAVVDAEHQDESHLADEHQAEKEGEAAHRIVAASLERPVIHLVDQPAHRVEGGNDDRRGQKRI